ncbi:p-hydroxybenzoic acid efflux pump subunit AaeB [Pseudomonas sp. URMO17WK12:I11]|uniref:FUSC family protein n=1 Tax=Pseudomonas sp. URMO17WK12:I11 TaxID=1283291 RepID=UPI000721A941|nr:FUSC family protein [Pseudomonas sp. URMO17WK12:I11]CRN05970.1 p-hydroxybenzoic acid efflux pump subunit AaeB [Pseudomonas sp. URMO17WK12:I11]
MNGFFSSVPPARDWFYGVRTFAASMIALYIALLMQLPRPYWAMATVYIVSSPFLGPTSSKALYRALGTLLGAAGAVLLVPPLVQSPLLLSIAVALWTGTLLFLSLNVRTANNYVFMLAGYTLPMIALAVVDNPLAVFDVASSRAQEICLGIVCAAVVGAIFWPRRLAPVVVGATGNWFNEAIRYSDSYLVRQQSTVDVGGMRGAMVATFNSLELMIGQLGHEGTGPHTLKNARELRGRMIHLLPVIDALDDALTALQGRAAQQFEQILPVLDAAREWLKGTAESPSVQQWAALHQRIDELRPDAAALDQRAELLLSNALYRLTEWVDLWQDCCTLQHALRTDDATPWRAVYRHWRLARLRPFFDRGLMLYSVTSTVLAIIVACGLWIGLGWNDGASAVILAAVSCSFFAAMDDPAPQIYRFFFWTLLSVIFSSLYLFLVLPNLHDFPMLVLAFAVPFICIGTLTVQPRFYLGTLLTIVNTSTFISIQGAYDADFFTFLNSNLAGPVGLLFAFIWTLVMRPFGVELAAKRMTRFAWRDIVEVTEYATLAEHRKVGVKMLDRLMQHLPRLSQTGQDSSVALRDLRVGLNLLDLLAYMPRAGQVARERLTLVIAEVGAHYAACLRAGERLHAPPALLRNMERARLALSLDEPCERLDARPHLLHALAGLRLALLPGVEVMLESAEQLQLPSGLDGAPL